MNLLLFPLPEGEGRIPIFSALLPTAYYFLSTPDFVEGDK